MRRDDPLPEEFKFGCCALRRGDPPHSPSGLRNAGRRCERARSKQGFFDKRGAGASDFIERIRVRDGGARVGLSPQRQSSPWARLAPFGQRLSRDESPDRVTCVTRSSHPRFYFPS